MRYLFFIIWFIPVTASAQSVSVAPYSFSFWGTIHSTSQFTVEYGMAGLHYFHAWDDTVYRTTESRQIVMKSSAAAISLIPVDIRYLRFGGALFSHPFPITSGNRLHFYLELNLPVQRFDISYRHISNGFNMFTEHNPGFDAIAVRYRF